MAIVVDGMYSYAETDNGLLNVLIATPMYGHGTVSGGRLL